MAVWNTISLSDIKPDRFDAEYFRKDYQDNIDILNATGQTTSLGRVFHYISRGSQPLYSKHGTLKALRSVNIGFMNFNKKRQEYVTENFYENNNRGKVQKDDVLITSTGVGTLGRTSIWYNDEKAYCDGHITVLRNSDIDPYLITAFLNTKYGLKQFDQNYRGSSGQIEIYPYDISKFVIPECIIKHQNEIGTYLRKSFFLKQESQDFYQQATQLLDKELGLDEIKFEKSRSYRASFSEVVSSNRLDPDHYKPKFKMLEQHLIKKFSCVKLGEIVSVNRRGVQPNYIKHGSINIVNSKHITKTHLSYDSLEKTTEEFFLINSQAHIKKKDILIYTTGAYVGQTNIYLSEENALASNHVNIIRIKDKDIDARYIALILNTSIGNIQTEKYIRGSAQAELYPNEIAKFTIPIIDKSLMNKIGDNLEQSLALLEQSKQLLKQAKQRVEELIENAASGK